MKLKPFGAIISLVITALVVYIYHILDGSLAVMIIGGIVTLISSVLCMGVALPQIRTSVLSSVTSALFMIAFIVLNIVAVLFAFSTPLVVILNAVALIIYALVIRGLWSAAQ